MKKDFIFAGVIIVIAIVLIVSFFFVKRPTALNYISLGLAVFCFISEIINIRLMLRNSKKK